MRSIANELSLLKPDIFRLYRRREHLQALLTRKGGRNNNISSRSRISKYCEYFLLFYIYYFLLFVYCTFLYLVCIFSLFYILYIVTFVHCMYVCVCVCVCVMAPLRV